MPGLIHFLAPAEPLADRVHAIALRRRDEHGCSAPAEQGFAANPYGALCIVHCGALVDAPTGLPLHRLEFSGPRLHAARRRYVGEPVVSTVLFKPGVVHQLLGLPAAQLLNARLDATPWLSPADQAWLLSDLLERPNIAQQVVMLEAFLTRLLRDVPSPRVSQWLPSTEIERVEDWAAALGCSPRHLQRLCLRQLGMGPKDALRLRRMCKSMHQLGTPATEQSLAKLASGAGYADAAHLARDLRSLTGMSPGQLRQALRRDERCAWTYHPPRVSS